MTFRKNVFRLSIMMAMTVASANVLAVDFGVPADDNPLLPGIDAAVTLTELATGYTAAGNLFDITASPNDGGTLNGVQYGPVAFGGVPGGAMGWVNSSYSIPGSGNYALAFWVSDVDDVAFESALAVDNVQLPGFSVLSDFSSLPSGWETFGSGGFSGAITGVSPTVGENFGFIDTLNNGFIGGGDGEAIGASLGVDTSVFGGTMGSVLLSSAFTVSDHDTTVSFDANFLSNDGEGFNDFALVQLINLDDSAVSVTASSGISVGDMVDGFNDFGGGEFPLGGATVVDYDFATAVTLFTADSADPLLGLDSEIPIMPVDPGAGIWVFPEILVVPDVTWWFDPEYAIGYDYTVAGGPAFASIELPNATWGDNCYNLVVAGVVIHDCATGDGLMGGTPHDLTDLGPLTALTITGIEVDAALDPADGGAFNTGFQFTAVGNVNVTQAPITTPAPGVTHGVVPEPSTLFLISAGILGFAGYRRKQMKA